MSARNLSCSSRISSVTRPSSQESVFIDDFTPDPESRIKDIINLPIINSGLITGEIDTDTGNGALHNISMELFNADTVDPPKSVGNHGVEIVDDTQTSGFTGLTNANVDFTAVFSDPPAENSSAPFQKKRKEKKRKEKKKAGSKNLVGYFQ